MPHYENFYWVNKNTKTFMSDGYLQKGETVQERVEFIGKHAESLLKREAVSKEAAAYFDGYAEKFANYMAKGWFSLASPVWANFGRDGLPISCNNVFVEDSATSILDKLGEVAMQTKYGAGTSAYLGRIRPRGAPISTGGEADGPTHFAGLFQAIIETWKQGPVRRGACAVYIDVEHQDIHEWLTMHSEGSPIQTLSFGVCITDKWLREMLGGDKAKRKIWLEILEKRSETGYPYLFFTDTVQEGRPQVYKDLDMSVYSSNVCTEIFLPSSELESFVCDLSSGNLLHFYEWKDTDALEVLTFLLDAVMTEYIDKTANIRYLEASNRFARRHRALGVGVLGWHSLLQSKGIPFASDTAREITADYAEVLYRQTQAASEKLAELCGEPELLKGYGRRNTTTVAIAPTTSSSFILGGVSQAAEPWNSNYFERRLAKGVFLERNQYLQTVLQRHGRDNEATWVSIRNNYGSVQHLSWLTENEREVFKTWAEIPQEEIIRQAAIRQPWIDQGQSVNLMIPSDTPAKELHNLHILAWESGLKSLYYQRTPASPIQKLAVDMAACVACEA